MCDPIHLLVSNSRVQLVIIALQVEFYFSRQNLQTDGFLVSQMNAQMCVPVSVIAQFHKIQQLTTDTSLIVESVKDSTICAVTPDGIKPTIKQERNTIILREIPSETSQDKVRSDTWALKALEELGLLELFCVLERIRLLVRMVYSCTVRFPGYG